MTEMETLVESRQEHKSKLKRKQQVCPPSGVEGLRTVDQSSGVDDSGPPCKKRAQYKVECAVTVGEEGERETRRKKCKRSKQRDRECDVNEVEEEESMENLKASKKRKKDKRNERGSVSVSELHHLATISPRDKKQRTHGDEEKEEFDIPDSEVPPEGVGSVPGNEELESGNGNKKRKKPKAVSRPGVTSGRNLREEAAEYLQLWNTDRAAWAFKKKIQYWLLQNIFDKKQVSKRDFKVLLRYLEGLQGHQRQLCIDRAHKTLEEYEENAEPGISRRQYRTIALLRTLA